MSFSHITTHVLDAASGQPAEGVAVVLESLMGAVAVRIASGTTDADGRIGDLGPPRLTPGPYRVVFDTAGYFESQGVPTFYPQVAVTVLITADSTHDHVPLLLSPFSYTTYRGS